MWAATFDWQVARLAAYRGVTRLGALNAHPRAQLVESAWSYQHRPSVGVKRARRQYGLDPAVVARAWAAQQRLCGRFRRLAARKHANGVVAAARARGSPGSLAEMTRVAVVLVRPDRR